MAHIEMKYHPGRIEIVAAAEPIEVDGHMATHLARAVIAWLRANVATIGVPYTDGPVNEVCSGPVNECSTPGRCAQGAQSEPRDAHDDAIEAMRAIAIDLHEDPRHRIAAADTLERLLRCAR